MNVYVLCGGSICGLCIVLVLKQMKSELASYAGAAASAVVAIYCIASLAEPIKYLREISSKAGLNGYFTLVLKCVCTAFICKLASDICRDCGESSLGSKVEMGGRIVIVVQTLPLLKNIFETAGNLL